MWEGKKRRELKNGCKLYYAVEDGRRNGVDPEKEDVIQINRQTYRVIWLKLEVKKTIVNITSAYTPQVGREETIKITSGTC